MKTNGIHTTNPTHKKYIPGDSIVIVLEKSLANKIWFNIDLTSISEVFELIGLKEEYPDSVVTLYVREHFIEKEFSLGTVSELSVAKDRQLKEFTGNRKIYFRLIVSNEEKQIIASNENLKVKRSDDEANAVSLIVVDDSQDLGETLWKLRLEDNESPILMLNNRINNVKHIVKDNVQVLASIIPEVLRQSILHLSFNLNFDDEDVTCFQYKWAKFISLYGLDIRELPNLLDEPDKFYVAVDFADDLSSKFCFRQKFTSSIIRDLESQLND